MKTISANEAKTNFGHLLMQVQSAPMQIHRNGKPVAVVISNEEYELIEAMKMEQFEAKIKRGLADAAAGRVHDGETFFDELLSGKYDAPDETV